MAFKVLYKPIFCAQKQHVFDGFPLVFIAFYEKGHFMVTRKYIP